MRVGFTELLVILAIVLLMFGSKKLPELADGMGKAIRNFKRGINSEDDDVTPHEVTPREVTPREVTPTDKQVPPRSSAAEVVSSETREAPAAERKS